jgi:nucleoside-diphosphate-sugar epimerase
MKPQRILIAGCGQIGQQLALKLSDSQKVWGLKRDTRNLPKPITGISADLLNPGSLNGRIPEDLDYVVYCLTPTEFSDAGYRDIYVQGLTNLLAAIQQSSPLRRLFFISSTSVYHQDDDSWVDEKSPTRPTRFNGLRLLEAETLALSSRHPTTIIRFSGIYGGHRSRMLDRVRSGQPLPMTGGAFTNRIHQEDAVGFTDYLIRQDIKGERLQPLYLASDSCPVRSGALNRYLADLLNQPVAASDDPTQNRTISGSMRGVGSKRCQNRALLESGYPLKFPSYREGYRAMVEAGDDGGGPGLMRPL